MENFINASDHWLLMDTLFDSRDFSPWVPRSLALLIAPSVATFLPLILPPVVFLLLCCTSLHCDPSLLESTFCVQLNFYICVFLTRS